MRARRSNDWGFPRWRPYGHADATPDAIRPCDRDGCEEPGTCPAPKAPNKPDRWYFCAPHAAEYNRNWNYFDALSAEDAAAQQEAEQQGARAYERAKHWSWGEGDGSRSRAELDALRLFTLPPDADETNVKAAHRRMAKENHPDLNPGDPDAARRFHAAQAAYEVLRVAAARRADELAARKPGA
jgi:hypothetical protein